MQLEEEAVDTLVSVQEDDMKRSAGICGQMYKVEQALMTQICGPMHPDTKIGTAERAILVNQMLERGHTSGLHRDVTFSAIQLLDRILRLKPFEKWDGQKDSTFTMVERYAVCCLCLAAKTHYNAEGFIVFTCRGLTKDYFPDTRDLVRAELDILTLLDWNVMPDISWIDWLDAYWTACNLSARCTKAGADPKQTMLQTVGLLTLAIEHELCLQYAPSALVAGVLAFTGKRLMRIDLQDRTRPIHPELLIALEGMWKWIAHPGFLGIVQQEHKHLLNRAERAAPATSYYPLLSRTVPWHYYCSHGTLWLPTTSSGFDPTSEYKEYVPINRNSDNSSLSGDVTK